MRSDYKTFKNLKDLKSEIISLDPQNDSANYLEHLLLNVLEIMGENGLYTAQITHTLHQELEILLKCQVNSERVKYFKQVQDFIVMYYPPEDYSIASIPKEWSWLPAERCDCESEDENID
ncbi:MAG: hypothetical protein R2837_11345 [Aliarcobacter sp.]